MKTTTSKGKTFEASPALVSVRDKSRLMLDVMDERPLSQVAADFEGLETLTQRDTQDVEHVYRGYTEVAAASRNESDGSLRITLKKPREG